MTVLSFTVTNNHFDHHMSYLPCQKICDSKGLMFWLLEPPTCIGSLTSNTRHNIGTVKIGWMQNIPKMSVQEAVGLSQDILAMWKAPGIFCQTSHHIFVAFPDPDPGLVQAVTDNFRVRTIATAASACSLANQGNLCMHRNLHSLTAQKMNKKGTVWSANWNAR